jgi:hypothetical protein
MRWWCWKMANMTNMRCVTGDGEEAKKILMGAVLLVMTVFEGCTV